MRLAIIDADTLLYIIALRYQDNTFDEDPEFPIVFTEEDYEDMYRSVIDSVDDIIFDSGCYEARCYLTGSSNFRYNFLPSYKWRRDPRSTPKALKKLKQICLTRNDKFRMVEGEEADDSCTRDFTTPEGDYEKVICHIDKDLNQVAGEHYGYTNKGASKGSYFVSEEEAEANLWIQVLAGDVADCYKGCPNVGHTIPKGGGMTKAERIIHDNLCVKPIVHEFTKGKKKGEFELRWEEYMDKHTSVIDRVRMWYLKGYVTKGGQGHTTGFNTTSGFEDDVTVSLTLPELEMSPEDIEFLECELQRQYNVAYMLRTGEGIPTEMKELPTF